jgi:hypothetical protein
MQCSSEAETPAGSDRRDLEKAILRTVIYSDMFSFPLKAEEIHRFLIGRSATLEDVQETLCSSEDLTSSLDCIGGYYLLRAGSASLRGRLIKEHQASLRWRNLKRRLWLFHCAPFIRMVAITGSLAANSTDADADVDMLLVCRSGRVYTSLMLFRVLRRLRLFRGYCANYVLDESSLALDDRDIFTARELVQSIPVYGRETYRRLLRANRWATDYFPSGDFENHRSEWLDEPGPAARAIKSTAERFFNLFVGDRLESSHYRWNLRFRPSGDNGRRRNIVVKPSRFKGHWVDHRGRILRDFEDRLEGCGLTLAMETESAQEQC